MSAGAKKPRQTTEQAVAERFDGDIAKHVATVKMDQGLYRHIDCRRPGTSAYSFRVITWPGALCISGDMGSFVFERIADMFEFFRSDSGRVNLSYWCEKLVAIDRGGAQEFNSDIFDETVRRVLADYIEGAYDLEEVDVEALTEKVNDELIGSGENGEQIAIGEALSFKYNGKFIFEDFWDHNFKDYTFQYVWCCRALLWAISQYDEYDAPANAKPSTFAAAAEAGAAS